MPYGSPAIPAAVSDGINASGQSMQISRPVLSTLVGLRVILAGDSSGCAVMYCGDGFFVDGDEESGLHPVQGHIAATIHTLHSQSGHRTGCGTVCLIQSAQL